MKCTMMHGSTNIKLSSYKNLLSFCL